jgi:hypothetical protein
MDADRDEPDMGADSGQEDVDREEIDNDEPRLTEHEQEKIEKTFTMPAGAGRRTLEIDNVWGSIEVVGTASDTVQLTVNKSIRAESKGKIEQARKEVTLDITQQADALKLYVNGPFRCDCHDCSRSRESEGYIVKMDFQVQVPRDIDIKVKTVNEGRVSVRDINGSFLGAQCERRHTDPQYRGIGDGADSQWAGEGVVPAKSARSIRFPDGEWKHRAAVRARSFSGFSIQDVQRRDLQRFPGYGAAGAGNAGGASWQQSDFSRGPVYGSAD